MPYLSKKQKITSSSLTVLYVTPNIYGTAPLLPTCHPERSGTPGVKANATTKHCRTVEPRPPGGAPAVGISVVPTRPCNAPRPPGTRTRGSALPAKSKIFRQPAPPFAHRKSRPQSLGLRGRLYVVFSARTRFFPDRCNQGCPDQPRRYGLHSPAPKAGQSRQLYKVEFETLFSSQNTISLP